MRPYVRSPAGRAPDAGGAMAPSTQSQASVDPEPSFLHGVYPFSFQPDIFDERVHKVEKARHIFRRSGRKVDVWHEQKVAHDELLSNMAGFLNPPTDVPATARIWRLNDELQHVWGIADQADWSLMLRGREIPFRLGELGQETFAVQLALFRVGIGFLTVRIKPMSDDIDDWTDLLHYFRFADGQRAVGVSASQRTSRDRLDSFFPEPALEIRRNNPGAVSDLLRAILRFNISEPGAPDWWSEVFRPRQLLPFAALFVHNVPEAERPLLVYRIRNLFHARQELHPSSEDLCMDAPNVLAYTDQQWLLYSREGGSFIAFDPPRTPFFQKTLPSHLRDQYFLLFLLALHQRLALTSLSEQVARHWLPTRSGYAGQKQREQAFERIRDTLLVLVARGRFTQVMQREHHHRAYRQWRATFEIDDLYRDVSEQVREMHDFLLEQRVSRLETRLSQFGFLIGIPVLLIGFLGINLEGVTADGDGFSPWLAGNLTIAAFLVGSVLLYVFRRWGSQPGQRSRRRIWRRPSAPIRRSR